MNSGFWKGKRVFLTGHTGFKGSWLGFWLTQRGAIVKGYALAPDTTPNLYDELRLSESLYQSEISDIRDRARLTRSIESFEPQIVFHLAAQPLVRLSYEEPVLTFETNVIGCANVLDTLRGTPSVRAIVVVTTDKVYLNRDPDKTFKEDDPLGGDDPYSASKAAQEMVAHSFRTSFFERNDVGLATARAGNVIGGGDWALDRLIPDCMRAFDQRQPATIRRPDSTRPWQHVLESLSGYLLLAENLHQAPKKCSPAYNFAPLPTEALPVRDVAGILAECWGKSAELRISESLEGPHEARFLKLNAGLAERDLQWRTRWPLKKTLQLTVDWYRIFYSKEVSAQKLCLAQIDDYERS